ncbi:hypothetical protein J5N97_028315 [Dioscorea zingiberensis]|uniref:Uncharacterized protein n=1 Tax=Dioscorea zingiberensis TaxID=325984 RepID=A0A9D5BYR5_9LILI|nr:hypothetical protein J5N97_028315 [Dioscorea zingiberensis]
MEGTFLSIPNSAALTEWWHEAFFLVRDKERRRREEVSYAAGNQELASGGREIQKFTEGQKTQISAGLLPARRSKDSQNIIGY